MHIFGDPFDSILNQYLLGLGAFDHTLFVGEGSVFIWFYFVLATFITQITFMNLMIAIMGDSFDRVTEVRE